MTLDSTMDSLLSRSKMVAAARGMTPHCSSLVMSPSIVWVLPVPV